MKNIQLPTKLFHESIVLKKMNPIANLHQLIGAQKYVKVHLVLKNAKPNNDLFLKKPEEEQPFRL